MYSNARVRRCDRVRRPPMSRRGIDDRALRSRTAAIATMLDYRAQAADRMIGTPACMIVRPIRESSR